MLGYHGNVLGGRKIDGWFSESFVEEMPCDLCSLDLKGLELSKGKEQIWRREIDIGSNCRGSEAKIKVIGKKREEIFP